MPGFEAMKAREEKLLCRTYGRYPVAVERALGSRMWDTDGREYVDLLAGIAVTALGHCNPEIAEVISEQAKKLIHVSNLFYQEEQLDLAESLLDTCHMGKVFFCNSGAEANEAAIKIARRYHQRVKNDGAFEVITLRDAFHGRTLSTLAATGQAKYLDGFDPETPGFRHVSAGDIDALKAAVNGNTAAVLMEMVQGESGIRPLDPEYARAVQDLCREKGILFMADEVQAGLCRSGKWWAFQQYGLEPDVFTSAKALANGLPLGAMLCTDEVSKAFVAGSHATTFGGGALVTKVGSKVLEIMKRDSLAERAQKLGDAFRARVRSLKHPLIRDVRGLGLLIGIELADAETAQKIWEAVLARGFVCSLCHGLTLRLVPALTIDESDLTAFAGVLGEELAKL